MSLGIFLRRIGLDGGSVERKRKRSSKHEHRTEYVAFGTFQYVHKSECQNRINFKHRKNGNMTKIGKNATIINPKKYQA